jgi:hypothetical protein
MRTGSGGSAFVDIDVALPHPSVNVANKGWLSMSIRNTLLTFSRLNDPIDITTGSRLLE